VKKVKASLTTESCTLFQTLDIICQYLLLLLMGHYGGIYNARLNRGASESASQKYSLGQRET